MSFFEAAAHYRSDASIVDASASSAHMPTDDPQANSGLGYDTTEKGMRRMADGSRPKGAKPPEIHVRKRKSSCTPIVTVKSAPAPYVVRKTNTSGAIMDLPHFSVTDMADLRSPSSPEF